MFSAETLMQGPFGLHWLRPQALFGIEGLDPIVHCVLWSMSLNIAAYAIVSVCSFPSPMERLQGAQLGLRRCEIEVGRMHVRAGVGGNFVPTRLSSCTRTSFQI